MTSILGQKLAAALKTLLAIEALAKVVFIVKGILILNGMPH